MFNKKNLLILFFIILIILGIVFITYSNKIKIQYDIESIEITDDMSGYILVIEIDKNIQDFF